MVNKVQTIKMHLLKIVDTLETQVTSTTRPTFLLIADALQLARRENDLQGHMFIMLQNDIMNLLTSVFDKFSLLRGVIPKDPSVQDHLSHHPKDFSVYDTAARKSFDNTCRIAEHAPPDNTEYLLRSSRKLCAANDQCNVNNTSTVLKSALPQRVSAQKQPVSDSAPQMEKHSSSTKGSGNTDSDISISLAEPRAETLDKSSSTKKANDKYCLHHRTRGHNTAECNSILNSTPRTLLAQERKQTLQTVDTTTKQPRIRGKEIQPLRPFSARSLCLPSQFITTQSAPKLDQWCVRKDSESTAVHCTYDREICTNIRACNVDILDINSALQFTVKEMGDTAICTLDKATGRPIRTLLTDVLISTFFPFHILSEFKFFEKNCTSIQSLTSRQYLAPTGVILLHSSQQLLNGGQDRVNFSMADKKKLFFVDMPVRLAPDTVKKMFTQFARDQTSRHSFPHRNVEKTQSHRQQNVDKTTASTTRINHNLYDGGPVRDIRSRKSGEMRNSTMSTTTQRPSLIDKQVERAQTSYSLSRTCKQRVQREKPAQEKPALKTLLAAPNSRKVQNLSSSLLTSNAQRDQRQPAPTTCSAAARSKSALVISGKPLKQHAQTKFTTTCSESAKTTSSGSPLQQGAQRQPATPTCSAAACAQTINALSTFQQVERTKQQPSTTCAARSNNVSSRSPHKQRGNQRHTAATTWHDRSTVAPVGQELSPVCSPTLHDACTVSRALPTRALHPIYMPHAMPISCSSPAAATGPAPVPAISDSTEVISTVCPLSSFEHARRLFTTLPSPPISSSAISARTPSAPRVILYDIDEPPADKLNAEPATSRNVLGACAPVLTSDIVPDIRTTSPSRLRDLVNAVRSVFHNNIEDKRKPYGLQQRDQQSPSTKPRLNKVTRGSPLNSKYQLDRGQRQPATTTFASSSKKLSTLKTHFWLRKQHSLQQNKVASRNSPNFKCQVDCGQRQPASTKFPSSSKKLSALISQFISSTEQQRDVRDMYYTNDVNVNSSDSISKSGNTDDDDINTLSSRSPTSPTPARLPRTPSMLSRRLKRQPTLSAHAPAASGVSTSAQTFVTEPAPDGPVAHAAVVEPADAPVSDILAAQFVYALWLHTMDVHLYVHSGCEFWIRILAAKFGYAFLSADSI